MHNMRPCKVTVVLLTYNRASYLKQAISGILAQTLKEFRLLIIDNASSDGTPEIVAAFSDSRIEYIRCQINNGSIVNCNLALSLASTPYLIITHDDDEMLPDLLSRQVAIFESDPQVNLVSANMVAMNYLGILSSSPFYSLFNDKCYLQYEFIREYCLGKNLIGCPTVMLRTEFLRCHNLQFSAVAGPAADTALWFDINLLPGKLIVLQEILYRYRVHSEQDSLANEVQIYCQFFDYIIKSTKKFDSIINKAELRETYSAILVPRLRSRLLKRKIQLNEFLSDRRCLQTSGIWQRKGRVGFAIKLLVRRPITGLYLIWNTIFCGDSETVGLS